MSTFSRYKAPKVASQVITKYDFAVCAQPTALGDVDTAGASKYLVEQPPCTLHRAFPLILRFRFGQAECVARPLGVRGEQETPRAMLFPKIRCDAQQAIVYGLSPSQLTDV